MHKDHILYTVSCDRKPVRQSNLKLYVCHDMENNKKGDMKDLKFKRDHNFHCLSLSSILDTIGEASVKEQKKNAFNTDAKTRYQSSPPKTGRSYLNLLFQKKHKNTLLVNVESKSLPFLSC